MFLHTLHCKFADSGYFKLLCMCLEGKNRMQLLGHRFPNAVSKSVTGRQISKLREMIILLQSYLVSGCCCRHQMMLLSAVSHPSGCCIFLWTVYSSSELQLSQALTRHTDFIYSCPVLFYNKVIRHSSGHFLTYIVLILMVRHFQRQ